MQRQVRPDKTVPRIEANPPPKRPYPLTVQFPAGVCSFGARLPFRAARQQEWRNVGQAVGLERSNYLLARRLQLGSQDEFSRKELGRKRPGLVACPGIPLLGQRSGCTVEDAIGAAGRFQLTERQSGSKRAPS